MLGVCNSLVVSLLLCGNSLFVLCLGIVYVILLSRVKLVKLGLMLIVSLVSSVGELLFSSLLADIKLICSTLCEDIFLCWCNNVLACFLQGLIVLLS